MLALYFCANAAEMLGTVGIGYLLQVFVEYLLGIDNRTNLKQIQGSCLVVIQITRQFYLHRTTHLFRAILLCQL